ncbi:hypothetical protein ACHAXR_010579 [Thalassiosira sp. AJA248-18]
MAILDEFDDAFLHSHSSRGGTHESGGSSNGGNHHNGESVRSRDGGGGTKEKKIGNRSGSRGGSGEEDDAISIGSSSSSSSSGSSSSNTSSSSSDSSVECLGSSNDKKNKHGSDGAKGNATSKADRSSGSTNDTIHMDDNDADLLDADLDDDDLVEFFSKPGGGASSLAAVANVPKQQPVVQEKHVEETAADDYYDFDSLDDDALAELEEHDFVGQEGTLSSRGAASREDDASRSSMGKKDTSGSTMGAKRDFSITYNGEKKECPSQEELVDSSDGEEERCTTNKENASPNKSKTHSSHFEKRSHTHDHGNDDILDLFGSDEPSPPPKKTAPDSPSSLDTPRALTPVPLEDATKRKEATSSTKNNISLKTSNTVQKAINPYKKNQHKQQKSIDLQQPSLDGQSNAVASSKTNSTQDASPPAGVIALPDIGLSPNAQQTEVQRLGITHDRFKPPPYTPVPDPIVHKLDSQNRPKHTRRQVAVNDVFSGPVKNLWKSKFAKFNHVQSEMANVLANSDDNVIVSAPTGAGKTALFEMAMARLFASNIRHGMPGGTTGGVSKARKVVYIAPNKALCEERQSDWSKRLVDIDPGIVCTTITGDVNSSSTSAEIAMAHLILTTPEKWDSITRKWNDQFVLLSSIKLLLLDEAHLIGETERGGCLESVISRMKTIQRAACAKTLTSSEIASSSYKNATPKALTSNMRIGKIKMWLHQGISISSSHLHFFTNVCRFPVAVSATLPNLGELASFVESGEAYVFDQSYRPVPLKVYVQACGHIGTNRYLFDKSLNQHVPGILKRFSNGRPAIVFCHSKKETEQLAEELTKSYANALRMKDSSALINFSGKTDTASLHRCIRKGIAFHHAGLDASDRRLVEEAFGSGSIFCLCATSTLAMGVNLPSHLVIIKGTSAYRGAGSGHQDIDAGTLLQMMGRAGRPGYDDSGTAVIMTDSFSKTRYENVSQGLKVVESHLMHGDKLTEVLNIEVSQGVITSPEEAVDWVKGTFLFRRIQSHPLFYGFKGKGSDELHSYILDKCTDSIKKLTKIRAITLEDDGTFSPDAGCHVMSRNFVDFETMKSIVKLPHDSGPVQLLQMMANCEKVQTQVRRNEKKPLNEAYKLIKYKLEGPQSKIRIQTPEEKAFVMLQAAIGRHFFQDFALRQQMSIMIDSASQILSAVEQYAKESSGHGQVATQGMLFRRSLYSSLWGENDGVLNQIGGVSQEMAAKLKEIGICTFADAINSSNEDIMSACNVTSSFASSLKAAASKILQRTLKLSACTQEKDGELELHLTLKRRVAGASEQPVGNRVVWYSLLIFTDRSGGLIHYSEDITNECEMRVQCPEKFGRAYIRLVSNLVGLDEQVTVDGNDHIQRSSFSLSPHVATKSSSTKSKKQSKSALTKPPALSRKRSVNNHRDSVSGVSDLRLHKRGKAQKVQDNNDDCIIVDPDAMEYDVSKPSNVAAQKSSKKKMVTPSPHPRAKHQNSNNLTPVRNPASLSGQRSVNTNHSQPQNSTSGRRLYNSSSSKNTASNRKGPRNARSSSWFKEKKQQKSAQQTAFNSPKENPFSSYNFDPNNIENSLVSSSDRSKQEQSIIPNDVSTSAFSTKNPRLGQAFRTPANRRKSSAASNRISSVGLLQQKAAELQQQHSQTATASRNYTNRGPIQMQHNMADSSSVHNMGVSANDGRMDNQYGERFNQLNQFMGPGTISQSCYFQRPGTSAGSVMQQSFGMAHEPSLTPPPFMGRGNDNMAAQNNVYMREAMADANRLSSAGLCDNFLQANYGARQFSAHGAYDFQLQNDFQSQHDFQLQQFSCNRITVLQ